LYTLKTQEKRNIEHLKRKILKNRPETSTVTWGDLHHRGDLHHPIKIQFKNN